MANKKWNWSLQLPFNIVFWHILERGCRLQVNFFLNAYPAVFELNFSKHHFPFQFLMDFIGVMGIWTNSTLFLDTLYLQIWGRRGGWARGAASPCSCRRTWRTTSWRRHCSPPVTPRPRTGDTVAVSQLVIYRQCIVLPRLLISWISPFVIADWNKRQDYIMVRWQGKN